MDTSPNVQIDRETMSLADWEKLLKSGWDRVGQHFFHRRHDFFQVGFGDEPLFIQHELMPLRYKLSGFSFTKSQRDVLKKNADLTCVFGPTELNDEKLALFDRWYFGRFGFSSSIFTWVSPENRPFPTHEVCFYKNEKLVACSFFDITKTCQYSTTAMYDPAESRRSLGTLTLLAEIQFGIDGGKKYHYPGHAYLGRSIYDYKKAFNNMEAFHWDTRRWRAVHRPLDALRKS